MFSVNENQLFLIILKITHFRIDFPDLSRHRLKYPNLIPVFLKAPSIDFAVISLNG